MPALSPEQLSALIAAIYDRAIDPGNWPETLSTIRLALGAENAALSLIDLRQNAFVLNYLDNVPDTWTRQIGRWGSEIISAWGGAETFKSMSLDEPFIWSRAMPSAPHGKNNFVDEVTSAGFADSIALVLARDKTVVGACGFGRMRKAGTFRDDELALARLLLPHLQRSISFSRLLEMATLRATAFEAALDAVAVPTMLVNERSELVHANIAAQAELERGELLRVRDGRVAAADVRAHDKLKRALETARDRPDAAPADLDVQLGSGSTRLNLLPLPRDSVRGSLAPSATAAIVLAGNSRRPARSDDEVSERLIARHGLTRAEASVAIEIARGDGRSAAADRLGIRENTVRTHLSAIFPKLGINRQAQLARLVEDIAGEA